MTRTAAQWCELLGGTLEGDGSRLVLRPASIENAGEGTISFIADRKYQSFAYQSEAAALIVPRDLSFDRPVRPALIRVDHPYVSFAQVLEHFNSFEEPKPGIHPSAIVADSAQVDPSAYIGPLTVIGAHAFIAAGARIHALSYVGDHCKIGEQTVLFPSVVLYPGVQIGRRCVIHASTVVGSDGFGFAPLKDGSYRKIPQQGSVIIEDDVEIGANCAIDRGTIGATIIRQGAKLDNLIQVAHNVEIGAHTVIAAQAGIAGSTRIGDHCQIGGQAGIVGHLTIAPYSRINAQSGVTKSIIQPGKAVTGSPAFDYAAALRAQSLARQLPLLVKRLEELEQQVKELQKIHSEEKLT
ncbi:MAG: UDP-3-O-(3-hydroxymyristoyl)glucosamine N-acyltransferase [Chitinophagales bacterium]|nr:UDP-3-O-(3-hydroxymyristoyl)glucosamine N-acyltransferase [Chitinophagales bacterium]MDW8427525.1 UDP-3-O-(3-hydroxymyristoyl)glucosamine N-acyltransferase [Chitinophagales bacterium]